MAILLVGGTQFGLTTKGTAGTTVAKAFPANITAGNAIIATAMWATTAGVTCSVADNPAGGTTNSWTPRTAQVDAGTGITFQDFVALNIAGGSDTVTATLSASVTSCAIFISEWSGVGVAAGAIDSGNLSGEGYNTASSTSAASLSASPSVDGCLVYGVVVAAAAGAPTAGTGFTILSSDGTFNVGNDYQIQTSKTAVTTKFTVGNGNWGCTALILAPPAVALSGTGASGMVAADVVAGGKTIILTVTNDTWIA